MKPQEPVYHCSCYILAVLIFLGLVMSPLVSYLEDDHHLSREIELMKC